MLVPNSPLRGDGAAERRNRMLAPQELAGGEGGGPEAGS